MKPNQAHRPTSRVFFLLALGLSLLLAAGSVCLGVFQADNNINSFDEPVLTLDDGWTLAEAGGEAQSARLPLTVPCGADGRYTLTCTLPDAGGLLLSPALRIYSNYVDVSVSLGGEPLYAYPPVEAPFSGATGNTYHFIRMPADYAGQTLEITFRCQLGDDITYLLNPPLLGSKATMLRRDVLHSLPFFILAGCMVVLALGLAVLYLAFRKPLKLNNATLYTALFSLLFAAYVCFETSCAQLLIPNGYMLCFATLSLLALLPLPLLGVFLDAVSYAYRRVLYGLMILCTLNFLTQQVLNLAGVYSVRAMIPVTHIVIIFVILTVSVCLFISDRGEKPNARRSLFSALPMVVGGGVDILLLNLNRPSMNNSLWFTLGVAVFIIHQFSGFLQAYFTMYHRVLETKLLEDMAYYDVLAGIGNRNAYERRLKELGAAPPRPDLCCMVADINDLKRINDTLGHRAGDVAIAELGRLILASVPLPASCYRTGGDEFVVLLEGREEAELADLAQSLTREAAARGAACGVPISLAVGCGRYQPSDGNINDFIRRVDTCMYGCKRRQKEDPSYPLASLGVKNEKSY